ncbi:hypothetical protein ACTFIR_007535 [Dictyostelium discoideum]
MATDDDADPFSQNKNYIGYFSKSSLEAQGNGDRSFKGLQFYTGIRSIECKILKLLGNAACCDIDGKVEYYNIKSEKSEEGFLLRSCEERESESILFSDLTILQACGKLLIKNKTDTSSITEKLAINLAFDVPVQEIYSIKADELKSVKPLSHFQEE